VSVGLRYPDVEDLSVLHRLLHDDPARMPCTPRYMPGNPHSWHLDIWPDQLRCAVVHDGPPPLALAVLHSGSERDQHASISLLHDRHAEVSGHAEAMSRFLVEAFERWPLRRLIWPVMAGSTTEDIAIGVGMDPEMTLRGFDLDRAHRGDVAFYLAHRSCPS